MRNGYSAPWARPWEEPQSAQRTLSNHVLLAIIVLLAKHLLQQEIPPLTHDIPRSEHSG